MVKVVVVSEVFKNNIDDINTDGFDIILSNKNTYKTDIVDADYIIAGMEEYNRDTLEKCKNLKMISRCAHGTDNIEKGIIPIMNAKGSLDITVAEITIGYILCALRDIMKINEMGKDDTWQRIIGNTLSGKTIGIIGYGGIGRKVSILLESFDVSILHYDIIKNRSNVTLDNLLKSSDIITLHCDLNTSSYHMINKESIEKMKDDIILINTSRGKVIKEEDLINYIDKFKYIVLDVFEEEPPIDNLLLDCHNVIVGMHTASCTEEGLYNMASKAMRNIVEYEKNK